MSLWFSALPFPDLTVKTRHPAQCLKPPHASRTYTATFPSHEDAWFLSPALQNLVQTSWCILPRNLENIAVIKTSLILTPLECRPEIDINEIRSDINILYSQFLKLCCSVKSNLSPNQHIKYKHRMAGSMHVGGGRRSILRL